ncbi:MAG: hypothetical protein EAZ36_01055, partial [Verrucomicrobia bacterium]
MPIQLHDSLSRSLRPLTPSHADGVFRFYNCGPTVYAPAHIGNFRTFVVNDLLRRLLELEFGADKVKHVRNLTDVDDRTIGQTQKEKRPLAEITKKWTDKFHADCTARAGPFYVAIFGGFVGFPKSKIGDGIFVVGVGDEVGDFEFAFADARETAVAGEGFDFKIDRAIGSAVGVPLLHQDLDHVDLF